MYFRYFINTTFLLIFTLILGTQSTFAQSDSEPELVPFADDDGYLSLQLPAEWSDVEFGPWILDEEPVGLLLEMSPDLDGFYGTWSVPGLLIGLSTELVDDTGGQSLLERYDLSDSCTYEERSEETEELTINGESKEMLITGDFWSECGGSETIFVIITAVPADPAEPNFLFFVTGQMVDQENEGQMFEDVLSSIDIDAEAFVAAFGDESDSSEQEAEEAEPDDADAEDANDDDANDADANDDDAPEEAGNSGFTTYTTDDSRLSVQVPAVWSDVQAGEWVVGGETLGSIVEASDDLAAMYDSKDSSGVVIAFTETPVEGLSQFILLDWYDDIFTECYFGEEITSDFDITDAGEPITLPTITRIFVECDDTERSVAVVESAPVPGIGVYMVAQSDTPIEDNLLEEILGSIELNPISGDADDRVVDEDNTDSTNEANDEETTRSNTNSPDERASASEEGLELQLRLQENATYRLRVIIDQQIEQEVLGESISLNQSIGMEYRYDVTAIDDDGIATVDVIYDWLSYEQSGGPAGDVSYDSDNPPDEINPLALGYAGLVNQGFSMKMTPTGQVIEVTGIDAMLDSLLSQLDMPSGPEADAILESVRSQFGEEAMTSTLEQITNIYPDGPIEVGDSWSRTFTVDTGFPMIMENDWVLIGRDAGLAEIAVETRVLPNPDASGFEMGGFELTYELEGSQSGTAVIDEASGWTIASELTQIFDGDLTAEGMTIPMSIVSTISMSGSTEGHDSSSVTETSTASEDDGESESASAERAAPRGTAKNNAQSTESGEDEGDEDDGDEDEGATEESDTDESNTEDDAEEPEASDDAETTVDEDEQASALLAAKQLAADGKVDEAIAAFEEALANDPTAEMTAIEATVAALVEAGQELYYEDKTWQALERYSEALELDPTNADAFVGRASVYRWFEEFDKSLEDLSTAIELGDENYNYGEAYSERGYIYYQLDDYERAVADLTRAIDYNNSEAWYFELRGYAYREMGDFTAAIDDFTAAIELNEDDYEYKWSYINRASGYRELNELERAAADATRAIELDPGYTWAYELRGRIYSDLDDHEKSIADMTRAIDFGQEDYDYSIAYGYRGYSYYQLDEYFEAVADLSTAIELFPRYTWAYETRGNAHSDNEQYEEAIADFTAALELEADNYDYSTVYTDRGIAYYELGEYELAVEDLSAALLIDPEYTWAYEWRGYANTDAGNYADAIADFTDAIELAQAGYDYQWAYANRANAHYNLGDYELAVADLDDAIALNDEYIWAYSLRGEILGLLGRTEEAMSDLRMAAELDPRSAGGWNSLCWYGALFGYADEVVDDACESAVVFADDLDKPYYQDSRGVARALTGDAEGALEDFRAFIEGYGDNDLRLEWIERLEAGEDPVDIFDEAMIQLLLEESIPLVDDEGSAEDDDQSDSSDESDSDGETEGSLPDSAPLEFTIEPSDLLIAAPPIGGLMAFSKDGSFRQQSPGDPLFMAVPSVSERAIDDPSDFALERLELTANVTIVEVSSHQPISIDGLDGFETVASGQATNSDTTLTVYQVVLVKDDSYIVLKGLVGEDGQDDYLTAFKEMARSLILK